MITESANEYSLKTAARFISGDYSSRDQGYVTQRLQELALPSLLGFSSLTFN